MPFLGLLACFYVTVDGEAFVFVFGGVRGPEWALLSVVALIFGDHVPDVSA